MRFTFMLLTKMLKIVKMDKDSINLLIESIRQDEEQVEHLEARIFQKQMMLSEHMGKVLGINLYQFYLLAKEQQDELLD